MVLCKETIFQVSTRRDFYSTKLILVHTRKTYEALGDVSWNQPVFNTLVSITHLVQFAYGAKCYARTQDVFSSIRSPRTIFYLMFSSGVEGSIMRALLSYYALISSCRNPSPCCACADFTPYIYELGAKIWSNHRDGDSLSLMGTQCMARNVVGRVP